MSFNINLIVGSTNPVKIQAAQKALAVCLPQATILAHGMQAPSGVPEQPMNAKQTLRGAQNRVNYCVKQTDADYHIAIEGGVDHFDFGPATFAYICIQHQQKQSVGRSALLPLPPTIFAELNTECELGSVMDKHFNTHNIKQKGGAIGLLTGGLATRESIYTQAIILAMAPFLNPDLY